MLLEFIQSVIEGQVLLEGARIDHPEDLIFQEGAGGAARALAALKDVAQQPQNLTVKFDGCVHPESVIQVNGEFTKIIDAISRRISGEQCFVLVHDFDTDKNIEVPILLAVSKIGNKEWVEIELENGDTIKLTSDHEVYTTNRGWVPAKDLTTDDNIKEP